MIPTLSVACQRGAIETFSYNKKYQPHVKAVTELGYRMSQ